MTNTLTFYSVSVDQLKSLSQSLKLNPVDGQEGATTVEFQLLEHPIRAEVSYSLASGQLHLVVLDKPALLDMQTIETVIGSALRQAAVEPAKAMQADITTSPVPVFEEQNPNTPEESETSKVD